MGFSPGYICEIGLFGRLDFSSDLFDFIVLKSWSSFDILLVKLERVELLWGIVVKMFESLLFMEFCWFSSSSFEGTSLNRLFRHNKIVTATIIAIKGIPTPSNTINNNWVVVNSSDSNGPAFDCRVTETLAGLVLVTGVVSTLAVSVFSVVVSCGCPGRYWQLFPLKPTGHAQWYSSTPCVQFPPFLHGALAHSSISIVQNFPVNPGLQVHVKLLTRSWQIPPLAQGLSRQSSTLSSHNSPTKPGTQRHRNSFTPSSHVPPLRQGEFVQSSSFTSQNRPLKPGEQWHLNPFTSSIHRPSEMQ